MNKKGFIVDMLLYIVLIFVIGIVLVVLSLALNKINDAWQSTDLDARPKGYIDNYATRFAAQWDAWMLFFVLGFAILVVITGFTLRSFPAFAMVGILLLIIMGVIGANLANAFNTFVTADTIVTYANDFPFTVWIMSQYPKFILAMGFLFIIILFAKTGSSSGVDI